jgi:sugar-specific transcriptional regulator TrmB
MTEQPEKKPTPDRADLQEELRELGAQIEAAVRAALSSERAQQLRRDLSESARDVTAQLKRVVENAQSDPRVQQASERGREAIKQAGESQVVHDVQEALFNGLTQINARLRQVVDSIENPPAKGGTTQQVPIETDGPAEGETTRLK